MSRVSQKLDRVRVTFDDDNLVANAGLLLPATLVNQLGIETLIDTTVRLTGRVGGAAPGRKLLTLMNTMLAGGSHIDHADMLRAGASESVVSHRVMAPSTLGTFLRSIDAARRFGTETRGHATSAKDKLSGRITRRKHRRSEDDEERNEEAE